MPLIEYLHMIPKIIHYCWLSGDSIPADLQICVDSWKKYLPDYKFVLWDLNRFDINQSLWVKQAFELKKYAFAADYIRLYAIYNYGGIYMDMDVEVVKPFDKLLESAYFFGFETKVGIEAGVFGAEAFNPFIKQCFDYYKNRTFIEKEGKYNMRPLPLIMYDILYKNYVVKNRTEISIPFEKNEIFVFPPDYLTAKSYETGVVSITANTYTIHHFAGSWVGWSDKLYQIIYRTIRSIKPLYWLCQKIYRCYK